MRTDTTLEIEKRPFPLSKYGFRYLRVGECFRFDDEDYEKLNAARTRAQQAGLGTFRIRTIEGIKYIWRTK